MFLAVKKSKNGNYLKVFFNIIGLVLFMKVEINSNLTILQSLWEEIKLCGLLVDILFQGLVRKLKTIESSL